MDHARIATILSLVGITTLPIWSTAGAQTAPQVAAIEEITVTARRREESITDVPLSIQAFNQQDLQAAGIQDLEQLATFTPNLDFQDLGNSQPGRFNSAIRFRGMDLNITTPTTQTGGFFVDGINVLGGASTVSYSDIASVEVIRGPQPVYFGRGTFGGAINYVTLDPGREFSGEVNVGYSPTFGSNDLSVSLDGPLTDTLSARATLYSNQVGAAFNANDGGELGEESTTGGSVILLFEPSDRLRAKARVSYTQDDDRAPASTFIPYRLYGNIPVGESITLNTVDGPQTAAFTQAFHRGSLPTNIAISSNTAFYPFDTSTETDVDMREYLKNAPTEGAPDVDGFGLRTDMLVTALAVDYQLTPDLSLSGLFGLNRRETVQTRDADLTDAESWVTKTWLKLDSSSAEIRLHYDANGGIRLMGGLSYAEMDQEGDVDGGFSIFPGAFGVGIFGTGSSSLDVVSIETIGLFGSVEYDILDNLTLALEGRYQDESIVSRGGETMATLTPSVKQEDDKFLPRVSLSWHPLEDSSLFVSYAEATLPGSRNTALDRLSPSALAAFQAQYPGVLTETEPETLDAIELGWKQSVLDGQLWYSVVAFTQDWENMKATSLLIFNNPDTGLDTFVNPTIPGSSTQKGIELEVLWAITGNLTLQGSYGFVDSEYDDYAAGRLSYVPTTSAYQAAGQTLPRSPKHSAAIGVTWEDQLVPAWGYSIRGDVLYRGKTYTDETNLAWVDAYSLFNLHADLHGDNGVTLGVYCTNCFDEEGWSTGRRLTDFSQIPTFFANQGAVVDPIWPREIGIRASYRFD
ncbi:MAG: TonB-dependent receptor [Gammaproteobacteria bacterium]|nr:TonB-dependent receptor [Gammaproteobacteria bacterium]